MVAVTTLYCLADIAAVHLWTGTGFLPAEHYFAYRSDIPHFATRRQAESAVRWMRKQYRCYLRVMAVPPFGPPAPCGPCKGTVR